MNKKTIKDATREWVNGFNSIPQHLIEKAFKDDIDNWLELTTVTSGTYAWSNEYQGEYEIVSIDKENDMAIIDVDGEEKEVEVDDLYNEFDSWLPMWGTLFTLESIDEEWIRDNIDKVTNCGFRIFEDQENGDIYLGVDGAGYDFYENHWIPLYKERGLQWHDIEEEQQY